MWNNKILLSVSSEKTKKLGEIFSKDIKVGDFIALFGELGSGKTTFAQGVIKGLGIKNRIVSPTFIILRTYRIPQGKGVVHHIDLYRISEKMDNMNELGIGEVLDKKKGIVLVEWAEKMINFFPKRRWEISFEYIEENKRKISIKKVGN